MTYEKKDGEGVLFQKQSKNGNAYWGGDITINGIEYWVNQFDKTSKTGMPYKSLLITPKSEKKPEVKKEQKEEDNPFNDTIPF